jgi:hypothetical protein
LFGGTLFALGVAALYIALSLLVFTRWFAPESLEQLAGWLVPAVPPLVTAALMPVFTPTLSQFRIRRDQLLRIFAYGASGLAWIGLAYVAFAVLALAAHVFLAFLPPAVAAAFPSPFFPDLLAGLEWLTTARTPWGFSRLWGVSAAVLVACVALALVITAVGFAWWWRFVFVALRDYLRLKPGDVWALFLSTQFISFLVCLVLIFGLGGDGWRYYFGRLLLP